ncbi:hypothetical protein EKG37_17410 [Robertmurraya yapensis]|uniref:Uncharacterized protein n=1 Tax=Bacillus yapensis TaxID=2492960 RepID=A0A431VXW4_9BACI|nr:hypothetical protein [Bacillus yapensis]RTR28081.1 hypothetical protein EKG37_17410 [Bacillus yapensis]TKS94323.1 hypothetical protein FAR12_17410 [Bacillus yapensis]
MKLHKTISKLEEKLRLQRIYEIKEISEGQSLQLPPGGTGVIEINNKVKGYIINRIPQKTNFEIFIFDRFLRSPIVWVFKRSGEFIGNQKFTNIDDALAWMIEAYEKDAEIYMKESTKA